MNCGEARELLSAYLDGELAPDRRQRVHEHLDACDACSRELAALKGLTEDLNMMRFREPEDAELQRYWAGVYNRLERSVGWVLFSAGAILLLCYGAFHLIEAIVEDPAIDLAVKVGACALVFGSIVLLVSILRERLTVRRADRYSKEVQR